LWKGRFQRFTMLCFLLYVAFSLAVLATLHTAASHIVTSITAKQRILSEWMVMGWTLEIVFWWSLAAAAGLVNWYVGSRIRMPPLGPDRNPSVGVSPLDSAEPPRVSRDIVKGALDL
jgi:hypothetical protein